MVLTERITHRPNSSKGNNMSIITAAVPSILHAADIDISSQWTLLWTAVTAGAPKLGAILMAVGGILVVAALVMWVIKRRTQRGLGDMTAVWGSLIIGSVLLAPAVVIPIILKLIDIIANIVVSLGTTITK
jgi:hypothetical protein